jgi:hypothetical protein
MKKKRIVDADPDEIDRMAAAAWRGAAEDALSRGAPVFGRRGKRLIRSFPDGRRDVVADAELPDDQKILRKVPAGGYRGRKARQTA